AGPDDRSPISINEPGSTFSQPLQRDFKGARVAWSRNLGRYPVQPVVNEVCDRVRSIFLDLECQVDDGQPDFSDADEIFQTLRAWSFAQTRGAELIRHRSLMKDTVIWNIEQGLKLRGADVARAEAMRTQLYHRVREFMGRREFL